MPPADIGPYKIISEIGGNERGRVFKAHDPDSNREVAVKMLRSQSLFTLTGERKFSEQLTRIKGISHPHLMPIIAFGDEDNRPYIVMPLMAGNLTDKMSAGPLAADQVLSWFKDLASGLDHAATNGVIHHDLKPNNILFDIHDHPLIADLGIFQVIESLSAANSPRANPYYSSPEQVRRRKLTGRSQQYALAALIFHTISGQVLFNGATELVASFKHTSQRPRDIHYLNPELNRAFSLVLKKALSKEPDKRYPSSSEFLDDLIRARGGAITPEQVRQKAAARAPSRPESVKPPEVEEPAVEAPELDPAQRLRMLIVIGISLSICICSAISILLGLAETP